MGSGASTASSFRLRKALVIRAYNIRRQELKENAKSCITLDEQFRPYAYLATSNSSSKVWMISIDSIRKYLNMDSTSTLWMESLLGDDTSHVIEFNDFIQFLETGHIKSKMKLAASQSAPVLLCSNQNASSASPSSASSRQYSSLDDDSSSTGISISETNSYHSAIANSMKPKPIGSDALVRAVPRTIALNVHDAHRRPKQASDGKQLWKKREIIKQEKTVEYTTIDETGKVQELVECEIHQTEILHMECKDTGEFAHRETTQYEQTEFFNAELINERHGTEEYVHLKSQDDEIEYGESTMPRREDEGVDDIPKSPRVEDDEHVSRRGSIQGAADVMSLREAEDEKVQQPDDDASAIATIASQMIDRLEYDEEHETVHGDIPYQFYSSSYASQLFDSAIPPPVSDPHPVDRPLPSQRSLDDSQSID
jgi:hypothetical protein